MSALTWQVNHAAVELLSQPDFSESVGTGLSAAACEGSDYRETIKFSEHVSWLGLAFQLPTQGVRSCFSKAPDTRAIASLGGLDLPVVGGPLLGAATGEKRLSPVPISKHRSEEMSFYRRHPEKFARLVGQWIVLENEAIIAHGSDPTSVVSEARSKGISAPLLLRVGSKKRKDQGTIGF